MLDTLTPRRRQLAECLLRGLTQRQVARRLGITINTVKSTRRDLYRQLGIAGFGELVAIAARDGLMGRE